MGDTSTASREQIEATKRQQGITTHLEYPPIPIRDFDWCAYYDPEGDHGWGRTELEAIQDLLDNYDGPSTTYRKMHYGVVSLGHISFFNDYEDAKEFAYDYRGTILNMSGLIIDRPVERHSGIIT